MKISWREKKKRRSPNTGRRTASHNSNNKEKKNAYFGHMIRRNNIHRVISEGPLEGEISRGRPRTEWITNITEWTGMRYEDFVRLAQGGAMEDHDSPPSQRRRHLMMMMDGKRSSHWQWLVEADVNSKTKTLRHVL